MPTKPLSTYTFATDPLFLSGPAVGLATKVSAPTAQGFVPGAGIDAESLNYLKNIDGEWVTWLSLGTFAPDEDAHVVETDAAGQINVARLDVSGASAGGPLESATISAPTAGGGEALLVTNATDGTRVACQITHNIAGGSAEALEVRTLQGSGEAATFTTSGVSTATSVVLITTGADPNQAGLTVNGGVGNAGVGVQVSPNTGRGIQVSTTNGTLAPLRLVPRDEPISPLAGDCYVSPAGDDQELNVFLDGAWKKVWATDGGQIYQYAESLTTSTSALGGALVGKVFATLNAADDVQIGDVIHLRGIVECGADVAGTALTIGFIDTTNAVEFGLRNIRIFQATSLADERYALLEAEYTAVSAGAQTFAVGFVSNGVDTVRIRNATIEIRGIYD